MKALTTRTALALLLLSSGCAVGAAPDTGTQEEVGTSAQDLTANAPALPPEVSAGLQPGAHVPADVLNHIFTLEHFVNVGPDREIHVTEEFTLRAFFRNPRRGILLLPGPLTKEDFYNIDVDGYRGIDRLAERGFFTFAADFEGTGQSTFPVDGRSPTQDTQIQAMERVIEYFRLIRHVPKLDILGESWGGGVAAELCADFVRTRSCTLGSMIYKTASPFADQTFRSPQFRAFLDSLPDGYVPTFPDFYLPIYALSPPAVQDWIRANEPGRYTTVPLYDVFDLPFFDPTIARVPGQIIQGELDPNQPLSDTEELAADYDSGGASLVVITGAGHIPRIEDAPSREIYWSAVEQFIDP